MPFSDPLFFFFPVNSVIFGVQLSRKGFLKMLHRAPAEAWEMPSLAQSHQIPEKLVKHRFQNPLRSDQESPGDGSGNLLTCDLDDLYLIQGKETAILWPAIVRVFCVLFPPRPH